MALSQWLHTALDFVFPAECHYCGNFLGDARIVIFCQNCWAQIVPVAHPTCPLCGDLVSISPSHPHTGDLLCRHCRALPPSMDRVLAASAYEHVVRTAIHQFKFAHKIGLGTPLAQLILSRLPQNFDSHSYHAIVPVPLHPQRLRQRGYNQSAILARELSNALHIPLVRHALRRTRKTGEQALIRERQSRYANIQGAFQVIDPALVSGKALILVDDVVTTGATASECARVLKQAGAVSVLVVAIARRFLQFQAQ